MKKIKWILIVLLFVLTVYTRFINLGWGLPYPMHPDERNMAITLQNLKCEISNFEFRISNFRECGNPHFFAYGQFPLYLGYIVVLVLKFFDGDLNTPVGYQEAVISLRFISALASVINVFVLFKIIQIVIVRSETAKQSLQNRLPRFARNDIILLISLIILIFSPALIQFAHFGTTESLLMLFYSLIIYQTLYLLHDRGGDNNILKLGLWSGLAIATKVSAGIFVLLPLIVIITNLARSSHSWYAWKLIVITTVFGILFSPHNLISFNEFVASIRYESAVATGNILVFYTRQFVDTVPIVFQFVKIFPYALGWPVLILFVAGFLFLAWKKEINILRLAFMIYFIPNAFLFAKWTRFMAPVFPIMLIFATLLISNIKNKISKLHIKNQKFYIFICHFAFCILIVALIVPGIAYLSVYQNYDVRLAASGWIYKNIPAGSSILSETANVVDLPLENNNYKYLSFNFYDLDNKILLQKQLRQYLLTADYIIVPSRRIFMNHPKEKYPLLNDYYQKLLSGKSGFTKVIEFSSYPKISWFGRTIFEFPDEMTEETWTVFDHPVVRIYENKIKNQKY